MEGPAQRGAGGGKEFLVQYLGDLAFELVQDKTFDHEGVGCRGPGIGPVRGHGAKEDDRYSGIGPFYALQGVPSRPSTMVGIENDHIRPCRMETLQGGGDITAPHHRMSLSGKLLTQELNDTRIIVDHEDLGHGSFLGPSREPYPRRGVAFKV